MSVSPFDSALLGNLFSDPEIAALFDDRAQIASMLLFESALAAAEARAGVIPEKSATRIAEVCRDFTPDPASLAAGTASAGVPVPALVKALKAEIGGDDARYVHFGATSQDVVDSALVLQLRDAVAIIRRRIRKLAKALSAHADKHRTTVMIGRTRSQQAVPTTFGLKAAGWLAPLVRIDHRIDNLSSDLLRISFGGAAGTLASIGVKAADVESNLSEELDLPLADMPWHAQRDVLVDFASQLTALTGALGKMGQDLVLLAQSEIAEVQPGKGGGSSTMPHKSNPVQAEMLVTLARFNAGLLGTFAQAQLHDHERSGASWLLEWLTLPQIITATGAALAQAVDLVPDLKINADRMAENLELSRGAMLAEAATFALADHLGRDAADKLVKDAIAKSAENASNLFDELPKLTDAPVDWDHVRNPVNYIGQSDVFIDRVLGAAKRGLRD
ncbi:MAG: 3-carboxy-cis,cis-muconate cycloisomerase [Thalassospira sp.]|uniref:3-carboxy-cis,cis-muconate cycloisomerase n=1 Tax=Thalassospira sp. TaxID=1912094 RepID=UPI001B272EDC|nr:3-carboxy-cis,cis-muconate cycloisomerase [Thalassospira sp.]MBO6579805.1 3-carboxy-cis,cis-muconate cycloisomerase [Thalassospira sp.]MBO6819580.1 3-carboxy-cis,cis-muconate cycloisomerase [Thalassospira sp.]MBO6888589.1 3-carboxy-cis,cis-muconate cycloisomerase [Thalassospira sp.]